MTTQVIDDDDQEEDIETNPMESWTFFVSFVS